MCIDNIKNFEKLLVKANYNLNFLKKKRKKKFRNLKVNVSKITKQLYFT